MRQSAMIIGSKWELSNAMALRICVDPKEKIFIRANTKGNFIFGRMGECGMNDVNVADSHITP